MRSDGAVPVAAGAESGAEERGEVGADDEAAGECKERDAGVTHVVSGRPVVFCALLPPAC